MKNQMIKQYIDNARAILFDFDDTLVETTPITIKAINNVAKNIGLEEITEKEFARCAGLRFQDAFKKLYPDYTDYRSFFELYYKEYLNQDLKIKPGVLDFIQKLYAKKLLGIVTNRSSKTLYKDLERISNQNHSDFKSYFSIIVTYDKAKAKKPSKEYYDYVENLLNSYKIKKDEALIIGDSVIDYIGATQSGFAFIAILSGLNKKQDFLDKGLTENLIAKDFYELIKNLKMH